MERVIDILISDELKAFLQFIFANCTKHDALFLIKDYILIHGFTWIYYVDLKLLGRVCDAVDLYWYRGKLDEQLIFLASYRHEQRLVVIQSFVNHLNLTALPEQFLQYRKTSVVNALTALNYCPNNLSFDNKLQWLTTYDTGFRWDSNKDISGLFFDLANIFLDFFEDIRCITLLCYTAGVLFEVVYNSLGLRITKIKLITNVSRKVFSKI